jgi:hypothetical protein
VTIPRMSLPREVARRGATGPMAISNEPPSSDKYDAALSKWPCRVSQVGVRWGSRHRWNPRSTAAKSSAAVARSAVSNSVVSSGASTAIALM